MVFEELVGRELKISLRQGVLFYYFFFPLRTCDSLRSSVGA